ncbi:hypothetical protein O0L34_g13479 [Tuta absoluta]|nr:hypothetical protein O0L34_g13479 [Tuta absoluta]
MATVASVQSSAAAAQAAFSVLSALQLTSYLWPQSASLTNGSSFDFIIAGGGAAGSVLANRLTENGQFNVLLIEAGGDPALETNAPLTLPYAVRSDADWVYTTQEHKPTSDYRSTRGIYYPAGKMLGGSGSIFLHFNTRADPSFYDSWAAALNDSSWSYDSILPYFKKSEAVHDDEIMSSKFASSHGTNGPIGQQRFPYSQIQNYLDAFAELGNKVILDKNNADENVGYFEPLYEMYGETVQHPARAYLSPAKDRSNLYVLKNTLATKILFDGKKAKAIEVLDSNNKTWTFNATKEVIMSAGAINTPQLLMLSGIGPKQHLESLGINVIADLPVGQEFKDLYGVLVGHKMQAANASTAAASPYAAGPIFVGFPALDKAQTSHPDYLAENFILAAGAITGAVYCNFYLGFNSELCQKYLDVQGTNDLLMSFVVKLDPKSHGKILLKSTDPKDQPLIYDGFLSNAQDQADLVEYLQDFTPVVNTEYFKSVGASFVNPELKECKDYKLYSTEYWNCYIPRMVISIFKYMSTCPMGKVVDSKLKVLGVESLRVVDASVFVNATRAHPMATVVMIAEKAADIILNEYSEHKEHKNPVEKLFSNIKKITKNVFHIGKK